MKRETLQLRYEITKLSQAQLRVEKAITKCIKSLDFDTFENPPLNSVNITFLNRLYDLEALMLIYSEEFLQHSERMAQAAKMAEVTRLIEGDEDPQVDDILQQLRDRKSPRELERTAPVSDER